MHSEFNRSSIPETGGFTTSRTIDLQSSIREFLKRFMRKARLRFKSDDFPSLEVHESERIDGAKIDTGDHALRGFATSFDGSAEESIRPFLFIRRGDRTEHSRARGPSCSIEQLLGEPIEHAIARHTGAHVEPNRTAQIGQVRGADLTDSLAVAPALFEWLKKEGYTWVVFTSRNNLRFVFERLHVISADNTAIVAARSEGGEQSERESAYCAPSATVFAGRLRDAWPQA